MNVFEKLTFPSSNKIKVLQESNFSINDEEKICLMDKAINIILFYIESPESYNILKVMNDVSLRRPGPFYSVCNLQQCRLLAELFTEVRNNRIHPLNKFASRNPPFILIYKGGFPINFYDGPADAEIFEKFVFSILNNNDFHISNVAMNEQIKYQMWAEYKSKNPLKFQNTNNLLPKNNIPYIPAIPYNESEDISEI
jgi:hypothetical protein